MRSDGFLRALSFYFPGTVLIIFRWQWLVNRTEWLRAVKVGQLVAQYSANDGSSISRRLCNTETCSDRGRGRFFLVLMHNTTPLNDILSADEGGCVMCVCNAVCSGVEL